MAQGIFVTAGERDSLVRSRGGFHFGHRFFILLPLSWWVSLAISVKRWHDRGKSGWWVLIGFIPIIGGLWALIETGFLGGDPGPNQYGDRAY